VEGDVFTTIAFAGNPVVAIATGEMTA